MIIFNSCSSIAFLNSSSQTSEMRLKNSNGKIYCLKSAAAIIPLRMLAAPAPRDCLQVVF
ncbi:hypothetical protein KsCSTR_01830 [Candidatus Kuenenia stuttgartiensis]|uniref:Uncharacterized protein n=1 Tax=Kuenenia stuttgartiensis TaxID=174633 RepID=Q1PUV7_KUEST|nr:hypothetical protein KsCSTR_01830 [Candidatus Kuenenia stuttgartiensis]CAJ71020.1 unknown protein [Candidatus Kuenenia stuttgartiensis]